MTKITALQFIKSMTTVFLLVCGIQSASADVSLSATLDGSGNLVIQDNDVLGKDNVFTINTIYSNLVITDAVEQFQASTIAGAILSNGNKTITIPIASITGPTITIDGKLGSDSIMFNGTSLSGKNIKAFAELITVSGVLNSLGGNIELTADNINIASLGTVNSVSGNITLLATGDLTIAANRTVNSGTGAVSLGADVKSDGTGDNGVGMLNINGNVHGVSITLRGADIEIASNANVGNKTDGQVLVATLTGSGSYALAFDASDNLFVTANINGGGNVTKFIPGATTPNATLTGVNGASALAFDTSGNLFVTNSNNNTVSKFAPGATTPTSTLTGLSGPNAVAIDASGNIFIANQTNNTVSKFVPGATTPSATLTGLSGPNGLVFDDSGNLFVTNNSNGTVSKFAPGATTPSATLTGAGSSPGSPIFDANGNLLVSGSGFNFVKYAPGATSPTATLAGVYIPNGMAFDSNGNLFVSNYGDGEGFSVSKYAPGEIVPKVNLMGGLKGPWKLAVDTSDNVFVTNRGNTNVCKFSPAYPVTTSVTIKSSLASRAMNFGGSNNSAVSGVNLTAAELLRIVTSLTGTITFGDTTQAGNITLTTVTPAGAAFVVLQSTSGAGQIVLDNASGTAAALNGNAGTVSLTAGTGGIVEAASNTTGAYDVASASTTTLLSSGAIGTSALPILFEGTTLSANTSTNNSNQFLKTIGTTIIGATGLNAGSGILELDGGRFMQGGANSINKNSNLNINGSTFDTFTVSATVASLTLTSGTLQGSGDFTSTGAIQTKSGSTNLSFLRGGSGLTQSTSGTTMLKGYKLYPGTTTISGGTLALLQNSVTNSPLIDVQSGAKLDVTGLPNGTITLSNGQTLMGSGTVVGILDAANGSTVSPGGTGTGILNTGNITFSGASNFNVNINGTTPGTMYDQVNVTGTVTINNPTLVLSLGYVPASGDTFVIVNNDGSDPVTLTGRITVGGGVLVSEGGSFITGGARFVLSYAGGTNNNDVVLTAQNISSCAIAAPAITYGGDASITVTVTGTTTTPSGSVSLTVDTTTFSQPLTNGTSTFIVSGLAASSHTLTANYAAQGIYSSSSINGTLDVGKADASVVVTPYVLPYDGFPHSSTITSITGVNGELGGIVGSVALNTTHTNAGTYAGDSWTFTGTANYNNIAPTMITNIINKATANIVVTPYTTTYDGKPHSSTIASISGVNGESGAIVGSVALDTTHTNAGIYANDSWTFTGTDNYSDISGKSVTNTINKADANVVVTPYTLTYDGKLHTSAITSITGVNGESGAVVGTVALNTTHSDAGTYANDSWTFVGAANYNSIAATTITNIIDKATATVVVKPYIVNYDGLPHSSTVLSVTGVVGDLGDDVGNVALNSTHSNPGIYANDSWTFTGSINYKNMGPTTITNIINPAPLSVTPTDLSKTYGTPNPTLTGTITGLQNNDNITATYSTTATTSTPAGKYTITATLSDPNNKLAFYTLTKPDGALTINKATPTITWPTPDRIFAGVALSPTQLNATAADPNSSSPLTGTFTYTPPAGSILNPNPAQPLNVAFQPDDAANYTPASATTTLTVDPATPVNITNSLTATIQKLDPFTYIITADGSAPLTYAATPLPEGLTLSGNTISGNPTATGVFYVLLTASNVGNQDSKTLKLTITQPDNHAPAIASLSATPNPAPVGTPITFSALATDIDGDSLDYTWDFGDQTSGTGASASKIYAAPGAYIVKLTISDGQSTATQTLNLAVQRQPDPVAFTIDKVKMSFNFIKARKDSLSLFGQIPLPPTFKPDGKSVRILIGNLDRTITLNSKGKSPDKSFTFKGNLNNTSAAFSYTLKNDTLFDPLSVLGFKNSSAIDKIDLPIIIVLDGTSHLAHITVDYSVKTKKEIPQSASAKN